MSIITATRYHDFSYGHRVAGHESKCAMLHGHNGRVHFTVAAEELDSVGRVLDFSVINDRLCQWVESVWDHKFLAWSGDTAIVELRAIVLEAKRHNYGASSPLLGILDASIVWTPFNPTAENMALNLLTVVGPQQLQGTGCRLVKVVVEETRKCHAAAELDTFEPS